MSPTEPATRPWAASAPPWRRLAGPLALVLLAHAGLLLVLPAGVGEPTLRPGASPIEARRIELAPPPEAEAAAPAPAAPPARRVAPRPAPPPPAAPVAEPPRPEPAPQTTPEPTPEPSPTLPSPVAAAEPAASAPDAAASAIDIAAAPWPAASDASAASAVGQATPPPAGGEVPVYATRIPPAAALDYDIRRGALSASGTLLWQVDGDRYRASLEGTLFGASVIEQVSEGGFDPAGLAPLRFADRRRGRDLRAANFQRDAGRITFSGPTTQYPLVPGAQDRLSWMVQLPAIAAAAAPEALAEGARISIFVAGSRGDADVWTFVVQPSEGPTPGVRLLRLPRRDYDTRIEVWLDPARGWWPVRAVQTTQRTGETTELLLVRGPTAGPPR